MKLRKILYAAVATGLLCTATSCSDYLDISSELVKSASIDDVFENPEYTRSWYGTIYADVIEYSETGSEVGAFKNPWSNMCGEISSQMASSKDAMVSGYTASSAQYHRWAAIYKDIRQAMIFLERGKAVGSDSNVVTEEQMARMKDEVRYLMAYYYFSLFELYGPAPIVTEIDDAAYPKITDYKRPSVDRMVTYIDSLLNVVITGNNLPNSVVTAKTNGVATAFNFNEVVRPTKVTAMALRAKLWVYAASPLFNGGNAEAMKLKDGDGNPLFPAKNQEKWNTAKQHLESLLALAEDEGHRLYEAQKNGVNQPAQAIYKLFQVYNEEILWCSTNNSYSDQYKMEKRTNPRDVNSCYGTIGPTQEAVDMFFMNNGLAIRDANSDYKEDALVQVVNTSFADDGTTRADKNVYNMYANREPRFYNAVNYQGKSWYKPFMDKSGNANYALDFSMGGGAGPSSKDTPLTGYMLGKFKNRTVNHASGDTQTWKRVSIIYRLAEFYLFYAEVLNEVDPSDPRIIEYIDKVRIRAGIPGYRELSEDGLKNIIGNYDAQLKAIQQERFVELYCEGQRYFDIRRWMICGPNQAADQTKFSGMNEYGEPDLNAGDKSYFKRTVIEKRMWDDKMYLYPIHQNVIQLSNGLITQNPGW